MALTPEQLDKIIDQNNLLGSTQDTAVPTTPTTPTRGLRGASLLQSLKSQPTTVTPEATPEKELSFGERLTQRAGLPEQKGVAEVQEALRNIPKSAVQMGKDIFGIVRHPLEFGKGLISLAAGAVQKAIPGEQEQEKSVDALVEFFKDRYGGVENVKQTAIKDPVGFLADIATVFTGGGALATKVGTVSKVSGLVKAGEVLSKAGAVAEPIGIATRVSGKALGSVASGFGKLGSEALGITTGAGAGSIRQAFRSPTDEFTQALRGTTDSSDILTEARDALHRIKDQRSKDYQKRLNEIAKQKGKLDITPIKNKLNDLMNRFKIKRTEDGTLDFSRSTISDTAEQNRITELIETINDWGSQADDLTPVGIDLLKRRLDDFYSPSGQARSLVQSIKDEVRNTLNKNVDGYEEMTKGYREASNLITDIEKALSLGDKASVDTSIRKLSSVLRQNNDFRRQMVKALEVASDKDILGKIAGEQLSSLSPRGLARLVSGGELVIGLALDPRFLAMIPLTSPRLIGEFVRALGLTTQKATILFDTLQEAGVFDAKYRSAIFQATRVNQ